MKDNAEITQESLKTQLDYDSTTGLFTRLVFGKGCRLDQMANPGGINNMGYRVISVNGRRYLAHRLAWLYMHGSLPPLLDHINRVKTDNRICNLRPANHSQNQQNTLTRSDNKSGHRGVHFYKAYQMWQVYINVEGKRKPLGYFKEYGDAVNAYIDAANQLHTCNPFTQNNLLKTIS